MTKEEVLALLESVQSAAEWFAACYKVKEAHGWGYPSYWFSDVLRSGLADRILGRFGQDTTLRIVVPADDEDLFGNRPSSK
jgi:hypothetical protein